LFFSLIDAERPKVRATADFGWTDYYTLDEVRIAFESIPL
jgi:hypothetical protein